ncbi:MAG: 4Fe-4S dicluster domain-containing protein [Candidatus Krumholzibacteriia bacterium]
MVSRAHKAESLARIRAGGVVGAGGSGFPTHLKLRADADTLIANGVECEPLLEKDLHLMTRRTERLLDGMARAAELVGAKRRIIAVKKKRGELMTQLRQACARRRGFEVAGLADIYPAGDEFLLVHELTGRRPPPGGFPTDVGVLVQNVETLVNLAGALDGEPVTETWLTVCGAVRRPYTSAVPLGTPVGDLLAQAGGCTGGAGPWIALEGGAMMGRPVREPTHAVTKTTSALLFLPPTHRLVRFATEPESVKRAVGRSACDQCSYCTQFCPRYLLGYAVEPHRVMRGLGFGPDRAADFDAWGDLCCECGLCDLYACPEDLAPRDACRAKRGPRAAAAAGRPVPPPPPDRGGPHPLRDGRLVPLSMLKLRLDLRRFDAPAPLRELSPLPDTVAVAHKQHAGAAGRPRLRPGDRVTRGQPVADVAEGEMGVPVHAPCDGRVASVGETATVIVRD